MFDLSFSFMGEVFVGLNMLWKGDNLYIVNVYVACY